MLIHVFGGDDISITIREENDVHFVKEYVHNMLSIPKEKISLMFDSTILEDGKTFSSYQITNNSELTLVFSQDTETMTLEEKEKEVERYLHSLRTKEMQKLLTHPKDDSIAKDISSLKELEQLAIAKLRIIRDSSFDDILINFIVNRDILSEWTKTPLFKSVLESPMLIRQILLSHPLIKEIVDLNPEMCNFLSDDQNISTILQIIQNPREIAIIKGRRVGLREFIEGKIGKPLLFSDKHRQFMLKVEKIKIKKATERKRLTDQNAGPKVSEESVSLLCGIIDKRPDLFLMFLKKTPLYQYLSRKNPDLAKKLISSKLIEKSLTPGVVRSIFQMLDSVKRSDIA